MYRKSWITLLVLALLMAPAMMQAATNPSIGYGYGNLPQSADVNNGGTVTYWFVLDVRAADGQDRVNLRMDFLTGQGMIQPSSRIAISQGGSSYVEIAVLSGSQQVEEHEDLAEGRYTVRVQSTVVVPQPGEYTSRLRFIGMDAEGANVASPGVGVPFTFRVSGAAPPPSSGPPPGSPGAPGAGPGQVVGLHLIDVGTDRATLGWSSAARAVLYEIHRSPVTPFQASGATLVGTTEGVGFTNLNLDPGSLYYYRVRAVDSQGRVGLASPALEVRTLQDGPTGEPANIFAFTVDRRDSVTVSWRTDQPTTSTFDFGRTPANQQSVDAGEGTSFQVDLGPLANGIYTYRVTAVNTGGQEAVQEGRFRVASGERAMKTQAPASMTQSLQDLGISITPGSLYFVDDGLNGRIDRVEDASGLLDTVRSIPGQSKFLMRTALEFVLLDLATDEAHPVEPMGGDTLHVVDGAEGTVAVVRVPAKEGWIFVSAVDFRPDQEIVGFFRGVTTTLPLDLIWRDGGQILFLDDPEQEYTILYTPSPDAQQPGADEGGVDDTSAPQTGGPPVWFWVALAGLALAAVVVVAGVVRAGRR